MFLQIGEQNSLTAAIFCKTSPPRRNSILANFWTALVVQVIYARVCVGEILSPEMWPNYKYKYK